MSGNTLRDTGGKALFAALSSNTTITFLDVTSNNLPEATAAALGNALHSNSTLVQLKCVPAALLVE